MRCAYRLSMMLLVIITLLPGCGSGVNGITVHGTVTLDGNALAGAELQFIPASDKSLAAHTATTDAEGKFTLRATSSTPVRPGDYVVVVNKWLAGDPSRGGGGMEGMKNEIPEVYRSQTSTLLKVTLREGDSELQPLNVDSRARGKR